MKVFQKLKFSLRCEIKLQRDFFFIQMSLIGKSASRHLDNLRQSLYRDCQNRFELATKPCSIVFNAYREDSYIEGGEDYLTFSGS